MLGEEGRISRKAALGICVATASIGAISQVRKVVAADPCSCTTSTTAKTTGTTAIIAETEARTAAQTQTGVTFCGSTEYLGMPGSHNPVPEGSKIKYSTRIPGTTIDKAEEWALQRDKITGADTHSIVEVAPGVFDIVGYKNPSQPTGTTNCCGACGGTTGTTGVSITEIEYSNGKIIGKHRIR